MRAFRMELRRALHRRLVWVLVGLALAMIVAAGIVIFLATDGQDMAALGPDELSPARLTDWWRPDLPDGVVLLPGIMLFLGALIGGASVVGAEWRSGGVTTVLTWTPRRSPVLVRRLAACGLLATLISFGLLVVFLLALVPSVAVHGTAAGADAGYVWSLAAVLGRISLLAGVAAVLGGAVANLGRATVATLAVVLGWMLVGEGLVRGLRPGWSRWLLGENIARAVVYAPDPSMAFTRPGWLAIATLLSYTVLAVVAAAVVFARRDVLTG